MNKGQISLKDINLLDKSVLTELDYKITCLSHIPQVAEESIKYIKHLNHSVLMNINPPKLCYSLFINQIINNSDKEFNIIVNHKVQPTEEHIVKTLNLLKHGYAFVSLSVFHFFGFSKELYRKIGHFDERYIPGEYEDCDFLIRLNEANLAWYMVRELNDKTPIASVFPGSNAPREWFQKKWGASNHNLSEYKRNAQEENLYNFGESKKLNFLDFSYLIDNETPGFKNI
jgi:hypothetical protein